MKRLAAILVLIALPLMGQSCDDKKPPDDDPKPVSTYCHGNDYGVLNNIAHGYEVGGITGGFSAIKQGDPSNTMRSTVQVLFGSAYCSGTALGPQVVLTAGHCGWADTTEHYVRVYERDDAAPPALEERQEPRLAYANTSNGLLAPHPDKRTFAFDANVIDADTSGALRVVDTIRARKHVVHPDYLKYEQGGTAHERAADLMLLFLERPIDLPGVTVYDPAWAPHCNGVVAQGLGRWELGRLDMREAKYVITQWAPERRLLTSRFSQIPGDEEHGAICFGDSGGPLYCDVGGVPYLCGVATTTMSQDCLVGSNHVNVKLFMPWIAQTIAAHPANEV